MTIERRMPYLPPPRASSTPGTAAHRRFPPLGGSVNSPPACGGALGELMLTWKKRDAWIGVFDILGFRNLIRKADQDFPRAVLTDTLGELLDGLKSEEARQGKLESLVFSDTLVVFAPNLEPSSYGWFLLHCKKLLNTSIQIRLPVRGAISKGTTFTAEEHPIVLGPGFVEAYEFCEDQDWIGLIVAPSATQALRAAGLEPLHHDFVSGSIPLRCLPSADVLAYRFQNGSANFDSPLLPWLLEMQHFAPESAKVKYARTLDHIQKHYRYFHRSSAPSDSNSE